jgi:hypothetical protein
VILITYNVTRLWHVARARHSFLHAVRCFV